MDGPPPRSGVRTGHKTISTNTHLMSPSHCFYKIKRHKMLSEHMSEEPRKQKVSHVDTIAWCRCRGRVRLPRMLTRAGVRTPRNKLLGYLIAFFGCSNIVCFLCCSSRNSKHVRTFQRSGMLKWECPLFSLSLCLCVNQVGDVCYDGWTMVQMGSNPLSSASIGLKLSPLTPFEPLFIHRNKHHPGLHLIQSRNCQRGT